MDHVDVNNKCRACLNMDPLQLFDWNDDILDNLTYECCFRQCTQLEEFLVDEPIMLCYNCASELKFTYDFIQKARESDRALRLKQEPIYATEESPLDKLELKWEPLSDAENLNFPIQLSNDVDKILNPKKVLTADSNSLPLDECDESKVKCKKSLAENKSAKAAKRACRGRTRKESPDQESYKIDTMEQDTETLPKKQLECHIVREHKQKLHLCHICSRTFYNAGSLQNHTLTHEENRERKYTCGQCGLKFMTEHCCRKHKKTHDSNRKHKFQCDQCEKAFFYISDLNAHKKQHTGITFECQICQRRFVRSIDLEFHLRIHTGDTPHKCPHCDKSFARVGVLNNHVRRHEGNRYKCDLCEKEYNDKTSLVDHRMQHTGLPLKCVMCDKGFVRKGRMRRHICNIHKVKDIEELDKLIITVKTKNHAE